MNNSWIDIPVVEAVEYFGGVLAQAYRWANRYAALFALVGLVWSGYKVMMSRMTVKEFAWDTMFKWVLFLLLMSLYPAVTTGFSAIGNQIGTRIGGGKQVIIDGLTGLRATIRQDLATQRSLAENLGSELATRFDGLSITASFDNSDSYADYMNRVSDEIGAYKFSSKKDRNAARQLVEEYKDKAKYRIMFGAQTLSVLERVLVERELDGSEGDDLTNTYVDLDIYLRDSEGNDTHFISPSALLKVALLSCQIMFEKENTTFTRISDEIEEDGDLGIIDRVASKIGHQLSRIPQMVMMFFCCLVLIIATVFAVIQYVMTVVEYTIIVGIAAIFIPLMLFDGTKDIPKKFIPVFTGLMVKMIVMTTCIMFVYYLVIQNCINIIADDGGMNWTAVGEIAFEAALCYVLTQNAPKIAQTILTGQPQLSMGEAVAGAGTALATAGGMRAAAAGTVRGAMNGSATAAGVGIKIAGAARAAGASLGGDAGGGLRFAAAARGAGAAASAELRERVRARAENFSKARSSIPVVDRAIQMSGLRDTPAAGGGGGGGGGASAHGISGQGSMRGHEGRTLGTTSNPSFATATGYDERTGQQRSMTRREFNAEKADQGTVIGMSVGQRYARMLEERNRETAAERPSGLDDSLTGGTRDTES